MIFLQLFNNQKVSSKILGENQDGLILQLNDHFEL